MPLADPTRRHLLAGVAGSALLSACGAGPRDRRESFTPPPIVFVHGNGDNASLWTTAIWRFESNGWPRDRLHAFDIPYPLARDDDTRPQNGRSSSADCRVALAAEVDRVLAATGASKVVLMANSRGGYAVRSYLANDAGAAGKVSHAILGGTPNHGVWADAARTPGSEFNGAGPFLLALNAPRDPDGAEVTPGVRWLTLRSDSNDKYAQPDGVWIGQPGTPTRVGFDGPALRGAENVVLPGADHRETAFGPRAFEEAYRFIVGRRPAGDAIAREPKVVLDGLVSGYGVDNASGAAPSNLPLVGATVEVYAVDPASGERRGPALHRRTIDASGRWGPFETDDAASHEFVIGASGYATTHVYRSPFPRSSAVVALRPERLLDADRGAAAIVTLSRPAGYFGVPRDRIALDGTSPPAGIPPGVAGVATAKLRLVDGAGRAVVGEFDGERLVGRAWPVAENRLVVLQLTG